MIRPRARGGVVFVVLSVATMLGAAASHYSVSTLTFQRAAYACDHDDVLQRVEAELDRRNHDVALCTSRKYAFCVDRLSWKMRCRRTSLFRDADSQLGYVLLCMFMLFACCLLCSN